MATMGFDDSLERTVADEELDSSNRRGLANAHPAAETAIVPATSGKTPPKC